MFGRNPVSQRKRPGCWFWVAVVAVLLNPLLWQAILSVLSYVVKLIALHIALSL
jgi:hypothetical protein